MKVRISSLLFMIKLMAVVFTTAFFLSAFLLLPKEAYAADTDTIRIGLTRISNDEIHIENKKITVGYSKNNKYTPMLSVTSSKGYDVRSLSRPYSVVKMKYSSISEASEAASKIYELGYSSHILLDNSQYFKVAVSAATEKYLRKAASRITAELRLSFTDVYQPKGEIELSGAKTSVIFSLNKEYGMPQISCSKKDPSYPYIKVTDNTYRGRLEFTSGAAENSSENKLTVVNIVSLESYLMSVVPSEMYYYWPAEALKAQAVCARSYAMSHAIFEADYNFDKLYSMTDTSEYQSYRGAGQETDETTAAVKATNGKCIYSEGKLVNAFYFSSSGGATESIYNVWGIKDPVFKSVPDPYEKEEDRSCWTRTFTTGQLEEMLRVKGYFSDSESLDNIIISKKTDSGRILKLKIKTTEGKVIAITKEACRTVFSLPSSMYTISKHKSGGVKYVTISGFGSGHGVGMPQSGAKGMAEEGYSYIDIIKYYYSNVEVK